MHKVRFFLKHKKLSAIYFLMLHSVIILRNEKDIFGEKSYWNQNKEQQCLFPERKSSFKDWRNGISSNRFKRRKKIHRLDTVTRKKPWKQIRFRVNNIPVEKTVMAVEIVLPFFFDFVFKTFVVNKMANFLLIKSEFYIFREMCSAIYRRWTGKCD